MPAHQNDNVIPFIPPRDLLEEQIQTAERVSEAEYLETVADILRQHLEVPYDSSDDMRLIKLEAQELYLKVFRIGLLMDQEEGLAHKVALEAIGTYWKRSLAALRKHIIKGVGD